MPAKLSETAPNASIAHCFVVQTSTKTVLKLVRTSPFHSKKMGLIPVRDKSRKINTKKTKHQKGVKCIIIIVIFQMADISKQITEQP